jgi:hypothetical protein
LEPQQNVIIHSSGTILKMKRSKYKILGPCYIFAFWARCPSNSISLHATRQCFVANTIAHLFDYESVAYRGRSPVDIGRRSVNKIVTMKCAS